MNKDTNKFVSKSQKHRLEDNAHDGKRRHSPSKKHRKKDRHTAPRLHNVPKGSTIIPLLHSNAVVLVAVCRDLMHINANFVLLPSIFSVLLIQKNWGTELTIHAQNVTQPWRNM